MIPRSLLALLSRLLLGANPLERLPAWLGTVRGSPGRPPEEISQELARGRRPGRGGPWLPPQLARWLRSPGCRQYAAVLCWQLRREGHRADLVVGVAPRGAHVWVECGPRAYDLRHPAGIDPDTMRERHPLVRVLACPGALS